MHCACLLSQLVQTCVSPNFVETYQVFQHCYGPDDRLWGTETEKAPRGKLVASPQPPSPQSLAPAGKAPARRKGSAKGRRPAKAPARPKGTFQYIRMELCTSGSVEDFLAELEESMPAVDDAGADAVDVGAPLVQPFLFQMVMSMYVARERLAFRHYDIKLANYLLTDTTRLDGDAPDPTPVLRFGFGEFVCDVPSTHVVKLADYGTADTRLTTLGQPMTEEQFATLENSPPEFLYLGDATQQGYDADTWGIGLCFLHLLTGKEAYDEILTTATCPAPLREELLKLWQAPRRGAKPTAAKPAFSVLASALEDFGTDTLLDTMYRIAVLLGLPDDATLRAHGLLSNPVLKLLRQACVGLAAPANKRGRGKKPAKPTKADALWADCRATYAADVSRFNLWSGDNPLMQRARRRMEGSPGARDLLERLLHWMPSQRLSMHDCIAHGYFAALRSSSNGDDADDWLATLPHVPPARSFMAYHNHCHPADGGDFLLSPTL